ncbi:hexosaminidase D-like [Artemia franciscana]|uniref:beta-N-acetylhexosaminidase n=1 Tax=Artemia franciscana TaxID=6661 RepID=A0AA88HD15_ARTSF|nr:hypothetical protein QYM36_013439 [Artemia franciscana]KAK2709766.1 hypothetical protein QYM36_013439 [Artemia franciscana]KAK2709767.1 hypothetical protein QYM36_013439 [Artemia franciscana]
MVATVKNLTIKKTISKLIVILTALGLSVTVYMYNQFPKASVAAEMSRTFSGDMFENKPVIFKEKIVHLDLKGAPPSLAYLREFIPFVKNIGATGLLVEYEDMFPYSGKLGNIPAKNAYSVSDIKELVLLAEKNDLELIPLVQTFGHLEFVLKLEEYVLLREVPNWHQVICPSRNVSKELIFAMLKQVKDLHPKSKRIHIGSDEVYNFGECNDCAIKLQKNRWTKMNLFLSHVFDVASYAKTKLGLSPMMWDDEFRVLTEEDIKASGLGDIVEIVVWQYSRNVLDYLRPDLFVKYSNAFKKIWAASAFKGATGADSFLTPVGHHLANHRSWSDLALSYSNQVHFSGIVLTGWQRYDHFSVLCELLPVGLPSLTASLILIDNYTLTDIAIVEHAGLVLDCDGPLVLDVGPFYLSDLVSRCSFPGSDVYSVMQKLLILKRRYSNMKEIQGLRGWLSEYNMNHKYSSPAILDRFIGEINSNRIDAESIHSEITTSLEKIYDNFTITEVIETYLNPVKADIERMWEKRTEISQMNFFPRRPF